MNEQRNRRIDDAHLWLQRLEQQRAAVAPSYADRTDVPDACPPSLRGACRGDRAYLNEKMELRNGNLTLEILIDSSSV